MSDLHVWQDDDLVEEEVELCQDQGGELHCDSEGIVTHDPILPETAEIIYGGIAFAADLRPALQVRTGRRSRRAWLPAPSGSRRSSTSRRKATSEAQPPRPRGSARRTATSTPSASAMLADAAARPLQVLEEGRARLQQELADNEARGRADIAAARSRAGAELRAEIARLSSAAIDQVVNGAIDGATHQQLIEAFIAKVGAGLADREERRS